jgi:hypothetical protein
MLLLQEIVAPPVILIPLSGKDQSNTVCTTIYGVRFVPTHVTQKTFIPNIFTAASGENRT